MSLFFVTGIAGTGKSALTHELKKRGYEAYNTDDDGLARWRNDTTGYIHPKSSVKSEHRTEKFIKNHSWIVPREKVEELAEQAKDKPVFLCGVAYNEGDFWDLFKEVFSLVVDDDTLKQRLINRTGNDWGKQSHELEYTLELQRKSKEAFEEAGQIMIDATKPIEKVADEILEIAKV